MPGKAKQAEMPGMEDREIKPLKNAAKKPMDEVVPTYPSKRELHKLGYSSHEDWAADDQPRLPRLPRK
jgi:hypothetical protein